MAFCSVWRLNKLYMGIKYIIISTMIIANYLEILIADFLEMIITN